MVDGKKICIATLELGENYGGMLQAYALQAVLKNMGHSVETTHFQIHRKDVKVVLLAKHLLKIILHYIKPSISNMPLNSDEIITENTKRFVTENIVTVDPNHFREEWARRYKALVVGSDQVWRQAYVPVNEYMFNFSKGIDITRISYAASFGRDDLSEYGNELIKETALLAKEFNAISVREESGVNLVKENWNLDSTQHVDPTLLVERGVYEAFIESKPGNSVELPERSLFSYVLDREGDKGVIVDKATTVLGLKAFDFMPDKTNSRKEFKRNIKKYQLSSVEQWLRCFRDAEFVVTDSFHGCVFSIIFNKSFIAIGNEGRGLARFKSLLRVFGLEDKLVLSSEEVTKQLLLSKIDWSQVNSIRERERTRSFAYLRKYLG